MSLEDKFYPEDGSVLTRFDNFMIKSAGKVGEAYQHFTGRSYKDLVKTCYKVSTAGFAVAIAGLQFFSFPYAIGSYSEFRHPKYESPLEEEIRMEAKGEPRKAWKFVRAINLALVPLFSAVVPLGGMTFPFSDEYIEENPAFSAYVKIGAATQAIAFVSYNFAEYLSKSYVPKPPKHTVWEKAKMKLKELLAPNPEPAHTYLDSPQFVLAAWSSDHHFT